MIVVDTNVVSELMRPDPDPGGRGVGRSSNEAPAFRDLGQRSRSALRHRHPSRGSSSGSARGGRGPALRRGLRRTGPPVRQPRRHPVQRDRSAAPAEGPPDRPLRLSDRRPRPNAWRGGGNAECQRFRRLRRVLGQSVAPPLTEACRDRRSVVSRGPGSGHGSMPAAPSRPTTPGFRECQPGQHSCGDMLPHEVHEARHPHFRAREAPDRRTWPSSCCAVAPSGPVALPDPAPDRVAELRGRLAAARMPAVTAPGCGGPRSAARRPGPIGRPRPDPLRPRIGPTGCLRSSPDAARRLPPSG